jgi:hypothetical protein
MQKTISSPDSAAQFVQYLDFFCSGLTPSIHSSNAFPYSNFLESAAIHTSLQSLLPVFFISLERTANIFAEDPAKYGSLFKYHVSMLRDLVKQDWFSLSHPTISHCQAYIFTLSKLAEPLFRAICGNHTYLSQTWALSCKEILYHRALLGNIQYLFDIAYLFTDRREMEAYCKQARIGTNYI